MGCRLVLHVVQACVDEDCVFACKGGVRDTRRPRMSVRRGEGRSPEAKFPNTSRTSSMKKEENPETVLKMLPTISLFVMLTWPDRINTENGELLMLSGDAII